MRLTSRTILAIAIVTSVSSSYTEAQNDHDLKGPISRMAALAFTESFPEADRIELYRFGRRPKPLEENSETASPPEKFGIGRMAGGEYGGPRRDQNDGSIEYRVDDVPIEYEVYSHITITGKKCSEITETWRSLSFAPNGAFGHAPPFGVRFYRNDKLLLETTVCTRCRNFYMPEMNAETGQLSLRIYGFGEDSASRKLFRTFDKLLPMPRRAPQKEKDEAPQLNP